MGWVIAGEVPLWAVSPKFEQLCTWVSLPHGWNAPVLLKDSGEQLGVLWSQLLSAIRVMQRGRNMFSALLSPAGLQFSNTNCSINNINEMKACIRTIGRVLIFFMCFHLPINQRFYFITVWKHCLLTICITNYYMQRINLVRLYM